MIRITFLRLFWPDAILTEEHCTFKRSAMNSMQAWLARPSIGGVVSDSLSASPSSPVMAFFLARGWILTAKVAPDGVSWIVTIKKSSPQKAQRFAEEYNHECFTNSLCSSASSVVMWLVFPRRLPCPRERRSSLLQLQFRNRATCPWKAHPC